MGIAERREREKEALRTRIVEAARDIISEGGLDALSMRSIAERIEYSPATIYLYFRDKDDLLAEVIRAGFERLGDYIAGETSASGEPANPAEHHRLLGRAYVRFALENTAYFRVMFELPTVPQLTKEACSPREGTEGVDPQLLESTIQRAMDEGLYEAGDPKALAMVAWGLLHGLTSLYLSGHLASKMSSHEAFMDLVEVAMDLLGRGMLMRETSAVVEP